jgi:class 3 adenylate cyclase/tetratricopeptide (TPR) repeat protein
VATCSSCGKELPGKFPFCPFCTAPLTAQPPPAVQEERKVVSVLFCDLVGFTAASDTADPEDVRARIRPYHQRLREELEGYGGTVEKFVGDAVMAVFGAPVSHEDDAERAVRAGLRILEAIGELNESDPSLSLQVRVGINTGEAVVALGARPEEGEGFVTGDVVNTASRLQGTAPVNGIAVSEQTYRATERIFDYEPLEPVTVKGKTEPLALYRPLAARARFGSEVTRTHATPLVGRELEKPLLIGTFERAAQQQSCQLVTVVGEPGVGKSRLCAELFSYIEERPGLVRWRQGRCLPYGEGIAFWALGEIVKAECGILESDSPEDVSAKLGRAVPEDAQDRPWLLARLGPLVGLTGELAAQEESFTAWRRFLEGLASAGPAVVVFEDLHWADPALLAFLEHLADWAEGVPLLVLCTARPELHEQHPGWSGGLRNAHTINLPPLSDQETAQLVSALLQRAVLPVETQQALLERAGGNPLYAEEFVRLLTDQGGLEGEQVVVVPESVQALIAARLDTLSPERKGLLQDASVVGKVFWAGALAAMGERDPGEVEQALHELARKELVRPSRTSSMEAEAEYGFWHALVRDVCYGQIPRAGRSERHRQAAAWIEEKAGERAEDLADVLAYHSLTALELAEAAGQPDDPQLHAQAVRYLGLAGERALGLDTERAEQNLARALDLTGEDDPQRPLLLERWAQAQLQQGRLREARDALEQALSSHRQAGNRLAAGRTLTQLSLVLHRLADPRQEETLAEALRLLEAESPGPELVAAHTRQAAARWLGGDLEEGVAAADKALDLAARLGSAQPAAALGFRGAARAYQGKPEGVEEMRQALTLAVEQGEGRSAAILYNNLVVAALLYEGPQAALDLSREGIEFCQRRGLSEGAEMMAGGLTTPLAEVGRTEEALTDAARLADQLEQAGDVSFQDPRSLQLRLLTEQGRHDRAPNPEPMLKAARDSGQPQMIATVVAAAASLLHTQAQPEQARLLLHELDQTPTSRNDPVYASVLPNLVRSALALDDPTLATSLTQGVPPLIPRQQHALTSCQAQLAEAAGNHSEAATLYADAAQRWQQFGNVPERAYALLGQGRSLHALGDSRAEQPLRLAHELFALMGYKPALAQTEALLQQAQAAAS